MAKLKLTKNELKKQKESLQRFTRYLPTLQLKKQQLQMEISKIHRQIDRMTEEREELRSQVMAWVDVFAEEVDLGELVKAEKILTREGNIAGIDIPVFEKVKFFLAEYDLMTTPLWVDKACEIMQKIIEFRSRIDIFHQQLHILKEELRVTNQRVNLFEKVKLPEARENIRVIRIYLGDLDTAGVVRGKLAKAKIEKRKEEEQQ